MATQFKLAAMGHTMETGRVVEWHVSEGESIDEGQLLISIETDKTVVDVNSPVSGVLLKAVGQVDAEYDVGDVLAWIGDAGETVPDQPVEPDSKNNLYQQDPGLRRWPSVLLTGTVSMPMLWMVQGLTGG